MDERLEEAIEEMEDLKFDLKFLGHGTDAKKAERAIELIEEYDEEEKAITI